MSHFENMTRSMATQGDSNYFDFFSGTYGYLVMSAIGGVALLFLATFTLREIWYRRYSIDLCPRIGGSLRSPELRQQERQQVLRDERTAIQIHFAQLENERTAAIMQKRKERRARYEVFLKSSQMVISKDDLYVPKEVDKMTCDSIPNPATEERDIESGSLSSDADNGSDGCPGEYSSEEGSEGRSGFLVQESHAPHFESDHNVLVKLPVKAKDGTHRLVDAYCSICLTDYEEGDTIIWASRKPCPHAFHNDCIMTWLSKGKKRCPCCRHFFVSSVTSVDDKNVIAQDGLVDHEERMESGELADAADIDESRASRSPASVSSPLALEQGDLALVNPDIDLAMTTQPGVN
jgi:hypothetical protein